VAQPSDSQPPDDEPNLVDQGLAAYRAGAIAAALSIWEEALAAAPGDARIKALVDFARQQAARGDAGQEFSNDFDTSESTNPELAHETLERVLKAEAAAADVVEKERTRPRRQTVISPVPELLAQSTKDDWTPAQGWSERTKLGVGEQTPAPVEKGWGDRTRLGVGEGAPSAPVTGEQTEPVAEPPGRKPR
jgi:hypothetical protein